MAQPPPATYPAKEIAGIVAFLENVSAAFESEPAVREEFFALLTGFGEGRGDAGAVVARATALLGGRPGLLDQFHACLNTGAVAAPNEGPAAATRPRRSNRSRLVLVTADPEDVSDGGGVDDERESKLRRKRERKKAVVAADAAAAGGVAHGGEDPRLPEALEFVNRVKHHVRPTVLLQFLEVLNKAQDDGRMYVEAIYDDVREVFGLEYAYLLRPFAEFLPGKAEWEEQQKALPRRERKRGHDAGDNAPNVAAKKPRADGGRREALHDIVESSGYDAASSAQRGRDDGKLLQVKSKTTRSGASRGHEDYDVARQRTDKKPCADGGSREALHDIGESSGYDASSSAQRGRDDGKLLQLKAKTARSGALHDIGESSGYHTASSAQRGRDEGKLLQLKAKTARSSASRGHDVARKRTDKRPRADVDGCSSSQNALLISEGGGSSGVGAAAVARSRTQDTGWRASNGDGAGSSAVAAGAARKGGEFDRFRALWEFATGYSNLVATMTRTEELIDMLPVNDPVPPVPLDHLFPSRDSREFLERLYGEQWSRMRSGLEDGELTVRALRVVLSSLRWAESTAVEDARQRRDHARAAEGLNELVTNMVDEERRRGNGGDRCA